VESNYQETEVHKDVKNDMRQVGLFCWYTFSQDSNILCVNVKDSSIEYLLSMGHRVRGISLDSVYDDSLMSKGDYDYIVAIYCIEYTKKPVTFLERLKRLIKPDGKILLGTDNRLGLRYFCGEVDNYSKQSFDGLTNYQDFLEQNDSGRAYTKQEIISFLRDAGFNSSLFFSVLPNLDYPQLVFSENYLPNENLGDRYFPKYCASSNIILNEAKIYDSFVANGVFHYFANTYLIESSVKNGLKNDIFQVTINLDRSKDNALATLITKDSVKKIALFTEAKTHLRRLYDNNNYLNSRGVKTVSCKLSDNVLEMPFIPYKLANDYFRKLLESDVSKFIQILDLYRNSVLQTSDYYIDDKYGIILKKGFIDLVPINCFLEKGEFIFFDQEFCIDNLPLNLILLRIITLIYDNSEYREKLLPKSILFEKYGMLSSIDELRQIEWDFLKRLRNISDENVENLSLISESIIKNRLFISGTGRHLECENVELTHETEELKKQVADLLCDRLFHDNECKDVYLYGSGKFADKFYQTHKDEFNIVGVIDSAPEKWNTSFYNYQVLSPEILKNINKLNSKIIICIRNYYSVYQLLLKAGMTDICLYNADYNYSKYQFRAYKQNPVSIIKDKKIYHVGYLSGVFDLYHIGHINIFRRAKEMCDYLIVGICTDEYVVHKKKKTPFIPFEERMQVVKSCRYVDEVVKVPYMHEDITEAWEKYHYDVQFVGSDYEHDQWWLNQKAWLEQHGATMVFFPYTQQTSSTKIKSLIEKGLL